MPDLPAPLLRTLASVLLVPLLAAGCAGPSASASDAAAGGAHASPEALVAYLRAAEEDGRYGEALRAIAPEERGETLYITWYAAAYDAIGQAAAVAAEYQAILDAYGLDEEALNRRVHGREGMRAVAAEVFAGKDVEALYADLVRFRVAHGRFGYAFGFLEGEVGEVERDGDRATVEIGLTTFRFQRHGDRWYWRRLSDDDDDDEETAEG